MTGIIWYFNKELGIKRFKQLVKEYQRAKINCIQKRISNIYCDAQFENGDSWRLIRADNSSRGYRSNIVLIEHGIPSDIVHEVIMPTLVWPPYRAYNYW